MARAILCQAQRRRLEISQFPQGKAKDRHLMKGGGRSLQTCSVQGRSGNMRQR